MWWLLVLVSCQSEGNKWCDCVIDNGCWDTDLCGEDPSGSCRWVAGDGGLPTYADSGGEVCFSVLLDCSDPACGPQPE